MPNQNPGIRSNDCIVTDNVISSARNLVDGEPLNPINFGDLCSLIEMVVLHERVIMTIPAMDGSSLSDLMANGIVSSTMFVDATPEDEKGKRYVADIYEKCLRTLGEGGVFGRGLINKPESPEIAIQQAMTRVEVGKILLEVDHGMRQVADDAWESVHELQRLHQIFTDYADAVFDAAAHFHVHAYNGSSEIPSSIRYSVKSVPVMLYDELKKLYKDRVDSILINAGYTTYDIPPFALIVLSRCKRREDIIPELLKAREEFEPFRATCTRYAETLNDAGQNGTMEDLIELHNDFDRGVKELTTRVTNASGTEKGSRMIYRLWDVVKGATPWGMLKNAVDQAKDYDIGRRHLRSVNGLMDVWEKLQKGSRYEAILRSDLFPNEFAPEDFAGFTDYLSDVRQLMPVGVKSAEAGN